MGFTWFASAFDTDDVLYKISIFIQILGALVLAAGIEQASTSLDFTLGLIGYIIMRFSLILLWFRVARNSEKDRSSAFRYIGGITLCQIGWVLHIIFVPAEYFIAGFVGLFICELFVPFYAQKKANTTFHLHHIIERYGLLTIIVLGECFLASVVGVRALFEHFSWELLSALSAGFLITLMMWWMYFEHANHKIMNQKNGSFVWGYIHYFLFLSIAAVGVGLAITNDLLIGHAEISQTVATLSVAIPLSSFLLCVWYIYDKPLNTSLWKKSIIPISIVLIIGTGFFLSNVGIISLMMLLLVILRHHFGFKQD